jgi:hypothetical protein
MMKVNYVEKIKQKASIDDKALQSTYFGSVHIHYSQCGAITYTAGCYSRLTLAVSKISYSQCGAINDTAGCYSRLTLAVSIIRYS